MGVKYICSTFGTASVKDLIRSTSSKLFSCDTISLKVNVNGLFKQPVLTAIFHIYVFSSYDLACKMRVWSNGLLYEGLAARSKHHSSHNALFKVLYKQIWWYCTASEVVFSISVSPWNIFTFSPGVYPYSRLCVLFRLFKHEQKHCRQKQW